MISTKMNVKSTPEKPDLITLLKRSLHKDSPKAPTKRHLSHTFKKSSPIAQHCNGGYDGVSSNGVLKGITTTVSSRIPIKRGMTENQMLPKTIIFRDIKNHFHTRTASALNSALLLASCKIYLTKKKLPSTMASPTDSVYKSFSTETLRAPKVSRPIIIGRWNAHEKNTTDAKTPVIARAIQRANIPLSLNLESRKSNPSAATSTPSASGSISLSYSCMAFGIAPSKTAPASSSCPSCG
mmetsp:Transcript_13517/g.20307  ORF Transcript_13517/g.20307 Transcript_13517/m.20307 type:complete len:239 (+) Transcript_13517:324-1040(+)